MASGVERVVPAGHDGGSVSVMFALLLPALLLVLALAVDIGNWYVHKRHLQMQADAAALAGGALFGDCFSTDPAVQSAANSRIQAAATAYAGNAASTYNLQVGGGAGRVTTLYNSKTFAVGGPGPDDTEADPPCQTPNLMLDVKQTEANVPYIFGSLIDWITPGSTTLVPAINARARVELKTATVVHGSLPLAVPDVNPRYVTATFVNEADGSIVAGPVDLTKGAPAGSLSYWSGTGSVSIPGDSEIGVRIGLGSQPSTCGGANGTGGNGFVCYDYSSFDTGLVKIHGVGTGGTEDRPEPRVWATTDCASSGGPFFSENDVVAPVTTCNVSVQAILQTSTGVIAGNSAKKTFNAVLSGGAKASSGFTYDAADGYWTTGYAFQVPVNAGAVDISLQWQSSRPKSTKQTYTDVQRVYSADDNSGPVKALSLSSSSGASGAPYSLAGGTHDVTVTVGLEGQLNLVDSKDLTMLRLTGGSRTSAIACDGPGASLFKAAIVGGCQTPYQINVAGYCPDPEPPAGPATCVPTQTGEMAGPTLAGMDQRFAACPANNWPIDAEEAPSDPRAVKLMITDFSALGGNGTTDVPVTNFATFYVTGWTGSSCLNNDAPPFPVKKGAIWGHFFKYAGPDPFSWGNQTCDPLALTPCIPVLVK